VNSNASSLTSLPARLEVVEPQSGARARIRTAIERGVRALAYCAAISISSLVALIVLATGVALTASLIFLGIGVLVWIAFVLAARLITAVDRSLAAWQRGQAIGAAYQRPPHRGFIAVLKALTSDPQTWKDMGWLGLTGTFGFALGLAGLLVTAVALADLTMPIWYWAVSDPHAGYAVTNFGLFTVDTLPGAFAATGIGLLLLPFALLFAQGCASAHAALAARVLGSSPLSTQATQEGMITMSSSTITPPVEAVSPAPVATEASLDDDRYAGIPQYSRKKIFGVWAAAAIPMGVLSWVVAPLTKHWFHGPSPLVQSLLVWLTLGLVWQFVLVLILLRQELDSFTWPRVRDALWLRAPRDPKTGRVGGKVWWWAAVFTLAFGVWTLVPALPVPKDMDLIKFMGSHAGQHFLSGAWGWFAIITVLGVFNTVLGEELLFRGLLLPRMRGAFGKRDWVANGTIFTLYHLHMPWLMPLTFVDGIFLDAYPSRRFQSAWMGIIVHSAQTVMLIGLTLVLVLR
jgi:membrane protease YdiL (CAAX protease family)